MKLTALILLILASRVCPAQNNVDTTENKTISYYNKLFNARTNTQLFPRYQYAPNLNNTIILSPKIRAEYKFYPVSSYYADGKFRYLPINEFGPYRAPLHLNNEFIMMTKYRD